MRREKEDKLCCARFYVTSTTSVLVNHVLSGVIKESAWPPVGAIWETSLLGELVREHHTPSYPSPALMDELRTHGAFSKNNHMA